MMTAVAGSLKAVPQIVAKTEVTEIIASGATKETLEAICDNAKEAINSVVETIQAQTEVGSESARAMVATFAEGTAKIVETEATGAGGAIHKRLADGDIESQQQVDN